MMRCVVYCCLMLIFVNTAVALAEFNCEKEIHEFLMLLHKDGLLYEPGDAIEDLLIAHDSVDHVIDGIIDHIKECCISSNHLPEKNKIIKIFNAYYDYFELQYCVYMFVLNDAIYDGLICCIALDRTVDDLFYLVNDLRRRLLPKGAGIRVYNKY